MTDLARVRRHLPDGAARVAVVARRETSVDLPGATVHLVDGDTDRLHEDLAAGGRHDAVVDLAQGPGTVDRFALLLPHVRRGGRLVVLLPRSPGPRAAVLALLDDVRRLRAGVDGVELDPPARRRDSRRYAERDRHALAASAGEVVVDGDLVVVTADVATFAVVREERFDTFLERAPGSGRVEHVEPGVTWRPSADFSSNRGDEVALDEVVAPPLSLRSFEDVTVVRGNVAWARDVVLPQAFRNPRRRRPRTPLLADWLPGAVRDPGHPAPMPLPGTYLHADNVLRGHFGHALTEQLSHLWAWERALATQPDLRVLVDGSRTPVAAWERLLLEAAGVPAERLHITTGPVRVERLLSTTPAYAIGQYAHPVLRPLHRRVGDRLAAAAAAGERPRRLFLTRRGDKRRCVDQEAVEALFVARGFTVVAPEEHPLPEQVALVRAAEVLAGYGGSGLFHLALAGRPTPLVAIASDNYPLANEKLFAALGDHPLAVVRGTPELAAGERFDEAAFHSDYTVDLAEVAASLESVL